MSMEGTGIDAMVSDTRASEVEVCRSSISATQPVPVPDDAYPYPTHAKNYCPARPNPQVYPYP